MRYLPYLLPWVRLLILIRSITSTEWDETAGRLVQPILRQALEMRRQIAREGWWNSTPAAAASAPRSPPCSCATARRSCGSCASWLDNWSGIGPPIAGITHQGETCSGPMPPEPSGSRLVICPMAGCAPHHVAVFGPSWRLVGSERTRPPQKSVGSGLVDTLLPPT
jgi:hypothetical protein